MRNPPISNLKYENTIFLKGNKINPSEDDQYFH
jgi:hypothetical protein